MIKRIASIDIGSYTARMIIADKNINTGQIFPKFRFRDYINVADYFTEDGIIKDEGINKTIDIIKRFYQQTKRNQVEKILAVATGVIRSATNKDYFINRLKQETGIEIIPISGVKEAILTAEGVLYSIDIKNKDTWLIIDIGGGSTEFFINKHGKHEIYSIPIGAAVLNNRYLHNDPPNIFQLNKLSQYINNMLKTHLQEIVYPTFDVIIGTGGSITSLAAVIHRMPLKEVTPEKINGKVLLKQRIKDLLTNMLTMDIEKRTKIFALDKNRAKVIIPGIIILLNIMDFFYSYYIIVSLSDLLEGLLLKPHALKEEII